MKTKIEIVSLLIAILFTTTAVFFISSTETEAQFGGFGDCDSSYPDVCIASPPPQLNCADIPEKGFQVLSPDPHGFDQDGDGIGCE